jgi:hypothetical protein
MSPLPLVMFEAETLADAFGFAAFDPASLADYSIFMFVNRINSVQDRAHIVIALALLKHPLDDAECESRNQVHV